MKVKLIFFGCLLLGILLTGCNKDSKETIRETVREVNNSELRGTVVTDSPTAILKFSELDYLKRGDTLKIRLNRQNEIVEEFTIYFEGLYHYQTDRYIFCRTPSNLPIGEGDSGSPILTPDGKIIGTLALGFFDNDNQFAATAIEDVMAVDSSNKPGPYDHLGESTEIGLSYFALGFKKDFFSKNNAYYTQEGHNKFKYYQTDQNASTKSAGQSSLSNIIPGNSIAVMFVTGDVVQMGAIGTASFIKDNKIWAFGHPLNDEKPARIPVYSVDMTTLMVTHYADAQSTSNPYKIGVPTNNLIGTLTGDQEKGILIDKNVTPVTFTSRTNVSVFDSIITKPLFDSVLNHQLVNLTLVDDEYNNGAVTQNASVDYILGVYPYASASGTCVVTFVGGTRMNIDIDISQETSDIAYEIGSAIYYRLNDSYYNPDQLHIKDMSMTVKIFVSKQQNYIW